MRSRFINALKSDMTFQFKQGFYYVYFFVTLIYMVILNKLPDGAVKGVAVPLTVFSDPSLIGFFFIGGIVMLEKTQGMFRYLAVTPLDAREYLLSKAASLSAVALLAGIAITLTGYRGSVNWVVLVTGILLSAAFFTLYGFIAAAGSRTMNEYFIRMVPYMLIIILPCFSVIGFPYDWVFNFFPSVAGLRMVMGAYSGLTIMQSLPFILILLVMNGLILVTAERIYLKMTVSEEA